MRTGRNGTSLVDRSFNLPPSQQHQIGALCAGAIAPVCQIVILDNILVRAPRIAQAAEG
jgi:hypothetical protein